MFLSSGDQPTNPNIVTVKAWGQGFIVGSLVIIITITMANMKKGVLLHKLIMAEVCCLLPRAHGAS